MSRTFDISRFRRPFRHPAMPRRGPELGSTTSWREREG